MSNAKGSAIAGAVIVAACIALYEIPLSFITGIRVSVASAHSVCSSSIGAFGQLMSPKVASACGTVGYFTTGLVVAGLFGIGLGVYGAYHLTRKPVHAPQPPAPQAPQPEREMEGYR